VAQAGAAAALAGLLFVAPPRVWTLPPRKRNGVSNPLASSGSRMWPAASADELARERQRDIQVATVGVTPLAPTTRHPSGDETGTRSSGGSTATSPCRTAYALRWTVAFSIARASIRSRAPREPAAYRLVRTAPSANDGPCLLGNPVPTQRSGWAIVAPASYGRPVRRRSGEVDSSRG
jgi:hypothetical protein